ncbi:MAG TPA: hypothetical protein VL221_05270 [Bacteroidota bacterium]|nr:hypothetical protein [Bacteroidota bacterium]
MTRPVTALLGALALLSGGCGRDNSSVRIIADRDSLLTIEVISCRDSVLNPGSPGCEDVKYGFEGGRVVKLGGMYHLVTAEMAGDPFCVNMRIAHWASVDGITWNRLGTLRRSDGDFTGNSQRAAPWGPMVVFAEEENRWHMVYVNYRSKPEYHNYDGVIQDAVSDSAGIDGIGGPYSDANVLLRYDVDPDPWEGLQGTDSFFPYRVGDRWYGFYGSATIELWGKGCKWNIGLASADRIGGPWKRMSAMNPIDSTNFAENPIVSRLDNGLYIAIVDGGPWVNKTGYILSWDGIHWSHVRHIDFEPKVRRWWHEMRTPLCLIKEPDGTYTMFFTAFKDRPAKFGMLSKLTLRLTYNG